MPLTPVAAAQAAEKIVGILKVPDEAKKSSLDNWTKIVGAIFDSITTNGIVMPTALIAPPGPAGGPVTGTGQIK
jgi:hypothetical protein